jgi:hypothetical protein
VNISDLYREEGYSALVSLAARAGVNPKYLYQCASGRRALSRDMIRRLIQVDQRLTLEAMFAMSPAKCQEIA